MNTIVSTGDVAGCAPVLAASLIEERNPDETLTFVGPAALHGHLLEKLDRHRFGEGIEWVEVGELERDRILSADVDEKTGAVAYRSFREALELCRPGENALLTLPLSKAAVQAAGHGDFVGHTETLEAFFGVDGVMSFFGTSLNVALITRHVPLKRVPEELDRTLVEETVRTVDSFYRRHDDDYSFALLGLNPHAGEEGNMGTEDDEILNPAVASLQKEGIPIEGPFPADSFLPVHGESVEMVFACYHDQGLVPFKQNHLYDGVHATLGLPVLRVSPDHGVAVEAVESESVNPESALNGLRWLRDHR